MAIDTIKSTAVLDGSITSDDLSYPLTGFSSTGIDDNATSTAITISSDEEVLLGKTTDAQQTAGTTLYQNGQMYSTVNGSQSLVATRKTSDGAIALFYRDTNESGRIFSGHGGTQLGIGTNTTGITFNPSTRSMMPANPSSTSPQLDATLDIGFPSVRWKDAYLSGGVYLGGTDAAHKLDDYEEGSWTPTLVAVSGGALTVSAPSTGRYTKVGRLVTVSFSIGQFSVSGGTAGATINIGGLPFTTQGVGIDSNGSQIGQYNISWSRPDFVALRTYDISTLGFLVSNNGGTWMWETVSAFTGSNKYVNGTITYMTTA